jgi:hypothetical protein
MELGALARSWRYVWKSQKVCGILVPTRASERHSVLEAHQQRPVDGLLAQVYYEFLQCHGLIVDADEEVA